MSEEAIRPITVAQTFAQHDGSKTLPANRVLLPRSKTLAKPRAHGGFMPGAYRSPRGYEIDETETIHRPCSECQDEKGTM